MSINYQSIATQLDFGGDIFPQIVVNDGSVTNVEQAEAFVKEHKAELEKTR